mmetsp:Transcript_16963/g.56926  ORF Transcript_16963/g.56926 Transcript_16963/m.56926 type:complete len:225 (-) Transcript_16963:24-698(-)
MRASADGIQRSVSTTSTPWRRRRARRSSSAAARWRREVSWASRHAAAFASRKAVRLRSRCRGLGWRRDTHVGEGEVQRFSCCPKGHTSARSVTIRGQSLSPRGAAGCGSGASMPHWRSRCRMSSSRCVDRSVHATCIVPSPRASASSGLKRWKRTRSRANGASALRCRRDWSCWKARRLSRWATGWPEKRSGCTRWYSWRRSAFIGAPRSGGGRAPLDGRRAHD